MDAPSSGASHLRREFPGVLSSRVWAASSRGSRPARGHCAAIRADTMAGTAAFHSIDGILLHRQAGLLLPAAAGLQTEPLRIFQQTNIVQPQQHQCSRKLFPPFESRWGHLAVSAEPVTHHQ